MKNLTHRKPNEDYKPNTWTRMHKCLTCSSIGQNPGSAMCPSCGGVMVILPSRRWVEPITKYCIQLKRRFPFISFKKCAILKGYWSYGGKVIAD